MNGVKGTPPVTPTSTCASNGAKLNKNSASQHPFTNLRPAREEINYMNLIRSLRADNSINFSSRPSLVSSFLASATQRAVIRR
jgi:hypothetical protein